MRPTGLTAGRARPSYVELGSAIVGPPPESQTTNSRLTLAGTVHSVQAFLPVPRAATKRSVVLAAAAVSRSFSLSLSLFSSSEQTALSLTISFSLSSLNDEVALGFPSLGSR